MKAAVFYDVEDIRLEDVPEPEIGDDDVLVEVAACGICGSDLEYYLGRSPVGTPDGKGPLILGHEFSGRVVKLGKEVDRLAEGDRVAVNPIQSRRRRRPLTLGQPALRPLDRARRHDERRLRPVRRARRPSTRTSCPTR